MSIRQISDHAWQRWRQRMERKSPFGLRHEIARAKQVKRNHCPYYGIRFERGYRYYVSKTCVFVVRANNRCLITLWRRE